MISMTFERAIGILKKNVERNSVYDKNAIQAITRKSINNGLNIEEIAELAIVCSSSGENLFFSKQQDIVADIASTGGPSSLSTLLCPLYLVTMGTRVAKVGVPGRPAGGIDVLAQIEGYKTQLTAIEIYSVIDKCGYTHFNAGLFAPLDGEIFRYRQENNAQNIPDLVIASLLSKKLCVGVNRIGLDVRVSPFGNFGATMDGARINASRFCEVAHFLGKDASCFLTNGSIPYQPYIGRSEALYALNEIFSSRADKSLGEHNLLCFDMAKELSGGQHTQKPNNSDLKTVFINNIECQNGRAESFYNTVEKVARSHGSEIVSTSEGFLEINLHLIRSIMVDVQKKYVSDKNIFPDPCGLILKSTPGQRIRKGDLLATLRFDEDGKQELVLKFGKAFRVSESVETFNNWFEVVKSA